MIKRVASLFTLTSLLACSVIVSKSYGEASAPTLKISGATTMNMYVFKNKKKANGVRQGYHLANDSSDLIMVIAGKAANGWEYRYKISMESLANKQLNVQQNFIEFATTLGILQLGAVVGPEDNFIEDGMAVMGGTGAADGTYYKVYQLSSFTMRGNDNIGDTGYNTKIVYITPTWNNFRLGIAYTPNTSHRGEEKYDRRFGSDNDDLPGNRTYMPVKKYNPFGVDVTSVGLSYKREFGSYGVNLNGAYVHDTSYIPARKDVRGSKRIRLKDVNAYQLGLILSYRTPIGNLLQLGSGYYDNGRSRLWKKPLTDGNGTVFNIMRHGNNGKAFNIALGYIFGAYKTALGYQHINRKLDVGRGHLDKMKTQVVSGTFDVIPVQGLKFYLEANYVRTQTSKRALTLTRTLLDSEGKRNYKGVANNKGPVVILGTKISF